MLTMLLFNLVRNTLRSPENESSRILKFLPFLGIIVALTLSFLFTQVNSSDLSLFGQISHLVTIRLPDSTTGTPYPNAKERKRHR